MKYKRIDQAKSKEPFVIDQQFGYLKQLNSSVIPGWIESNPIMRELEENGLFALNQVRAATDHVKSLKLDHLKEDFAKKAKEEVILNAKKALLSFLKKGIDQTRDDITKVKELILRQSEPPKPSDQITAMRLEMRYANVCRLLETVDPRRRLDVIKNGGKLYIEALINQRDVYSATPLISETELIKLRRDHAFKEDESLEQMELDSIRVHDSVRERAAQINATAAMLVLQETKLDVDVPPDILFDVFPARDQHEKSVQDKRVLQYQRGLDKAQRQKDFDLSNPGVNLQVERKLPVDPAPTMAKARARARQ